MLINNENIINNFKLLLNDTTKNRFEKSSYNKIINIISNLEYDITKYREIKRYKIYWEKYNTTHRRYINIWKFTRIR